MNTYKCIINSGLLDEINENEYSSALEELKISSKSYKKNRAVFFEGDLIDKFCVVESGSVRGEKTFSNGEVHIVALFEKGAVFALEVAASRSREAAVDFISNEDTNIVFISMLSIERSSYATQINRVFTYMLADSNIKMSHKIEILAERGLRARIITYLSILQGKSGSDTVIIKMNREQMAQFLCVNRSALSNELHKMKHEGLIDFKGQKFTIKGKS